MTSQQKNTRSPTAAAKPPSTNGASPGSCLCGIVGKLMRGAAWLALLLVLAFGVFSWRVLTKLYVHPFQSPIVRSNSDGGLATGFCNFDHEVCCAAEDVLFPSTVAEVQRAVQAAAAKQGKVRVVGGGHSMSSLVCDTDVTGGSAGRVPPPSAAAASSDTPPPPRTGALTLLSLDRLDRLLSILRDVEEGKEPSVAFSSVVEVEAGMRLIMLNRALKQAGLGLYNMGMIQEQSIGGLIATGVHGTGRTFPSVSNAVVSLGIVAGNGSYITANATHNAELFRYARVNLGLFGVVVHVSLRVRSAFQMLRRHKFVHLDTAIANWQTNIQDVDHYQMWWVTGTDQVFENIMHRLPTASTAAAQLLPFAEPFDGMAKAKDMLLQDFLFASMTGLSAVIPALGPLLIQLLPYVEPDRLFVGDSTDLFTHPGVNYHTVRYTEMEYFIPGDSAMVCLQQYIAHVNANMDRCPVNTFSPVRLVRGDDIPLSPGFKRGEAGSFTISYVLVNQPQRFEECARAVERIFLEFGGRPHWGKVHYLTHDQLVKLYDPTNVARFGELARELDPTGIFTTERLQNLIW